MRSILKDTNVVNPSAFQLTADAAEEVDDARGVVGKVEEERNTVERSVLLEVLLEEPGGLHVDSHRGEDDREVVLVAVVDTLGGSRPLDEASLATDLGGDLSG